MSTHQFRGQAPRRQRRAAGFSQASTRRGITLYDQHDREWTAQVEVKTGMPTGQIVPSFRAPWVPDQQYLRVNPENTSELFIDYEPMLRQRRVRVDEYHRSAVDFSREKKIAAPTLGAYTEQVIHGLGKPPLPIEPVIAAMQGNVYILGPDYAAAQGVEYAVDARLEPFVVKMSATEKMLSEFNFAPQSFAEAKARAAQLLGNGTTASFAEAKRSLEPIAYPDGDFKEEDADEAFGPLETGEGEPNVEGMLGQLDEQHDPEAMGGRRVKPQAAERAARQAPRRGNGSAVRPKHGASRSQAAKAQRAGRKTLADGAAPVISDGGM